MTDILTFDERMKIMEILYPTAWFDLLFYPDITEQVLDEFKIPRDRRKFVHVITTDEDVRPKIMKVIKEHYDEIYGKKDE